MGVVVPQGAAQTPFDAFIVKSATLQNAQTGNDNGTDFDITGMATTQLQVKPSSWTGTVTFWSSIDGNTFVKITGRQQDTNTIADNVANPGSTASIWTFQTAGLTKIRAVTTNAGGTSVTVIGAASPHANASPLGVTLSSAVLAAGSAEIGKAIIEYASGTAAATDQAGAVPRVSLYGKATAAGDTPIKVNAQGEVLTANGGTNTTPVGAAATAAAIKASAGTLHKIVVTTLGTAALSFYDNATAASGTILFTIPASAAVGSIYDVQFPAANGIWCASGTNTPAVTVGWS